MILVWTNASGAVSVTTVFDGQRAPSVIAALRHDGYMPAGSDILIDPDFPNGPRHQWRIQAGRVVVDPTVPDPPDRLAEVKAATTVAGLRAALVKLLEGR